MTINESQTPPFGATATGEFSAMGREICRPHFFMTMSHEANGYYEDYSKRRGDDLMR
jgi:hypothetical protein